MRLPKGYSLLLIKGPMEEQATVDTSWSKSPEVYGFLIKPEQVLHEVELSGMNTEDGRAFYHLMEDFVEQVEIDMDKG